MHYSEFETTFEARFQTPADTYPHAVEYHRFRFDQTIQYLLSSIKVSVKAPLTVGVATGSVLLANAIVAPTPAAAGGPCMVDKDCLFAPFNCLEDHGSCETL